MQKHKRLIAIILLLIITCSLVPQFKSYADNQVQYIDMNSAIDFTSVPNNAFQTFDNYDDYYDTLSGIMKNNIWFNGWDDNQDNAHQMEAFLNSMHENDYEVVPQDGVNFDDLHFMQIYYNGQYVPFENCFYSIDLTSDSYGNYLRLSLYYSPDNSPLVNCNYVCSENNFISSHVYYTLNYYLDENNQWLIKFQQTNSFQVDTQYNNYVSLQPYQEIYEYYSTGNVTYTGAGAIYTNIPMIYMWKDDNETTDDDYLGDSGYQYQNYCVYHYFTDVDTTGFDVDRRVSPIVGEVTEQGSLGVVQGTFANMVTGTMDNMNLYVAYKLNQYTKSIQGRVNMKIDYEFICYANIDGEQYNFDEIFSECTGYLDSYQVNNTSLIAVDLDKVFDNIYATPNYDTGYMGSVYQGILGIDIMPKMLNANAYLGALYKCGFLSTTTDFLIPYQEQPTVWDDLAKKFTYIFGTPESMKAPKIENQFQQGARTHTYNQMTDCKLKITEYLYDEVNDVSSDTVIVYYDFMTGDYSSVGTFEDDGTEIFDGFDDDKVAPSDNGDNSVASNSSSSSSSSASAIGINGDVNITTGAANTVAMIDIPFTEAVGHTPNLQSLYTTFRSQLVSYTDDSDSLIDLCKDTYTYLPAEIWGYIGFSVLTVCGIGVYRFFRGRG